MIRKSRPKWALSLFAAAAVLACSAPNASAETRTVRVAKQFGISYLPLSVMEEKGLIESEGKKLGLDLKTEWLRFTGGPPMNEAIVFASQRNGYDFAILQTGASIVECDDTLESFEAAISGRTACLVWFAGATGLALLNAEVNRQAAAIGYLNDFKLMMLLTLVSMPLVLLMRGGKASSGGNAGADAAAAH